MSNYTDRLDRYMEAIHSIDLGMVYCYTWNIVLHENPMAPNMATRKSRLIIGKQNKIDQKTKMYLHVTYFVSFNIADTLSLGHTFPYRH